mgnify:CR=1 FL=1
MKTTYILIDYENVQPSLAAVLAQEHIKLILFVGANQPKINFDVAEAIQRLGDRAQYVKVCGSGADALDFHIAYYIGHLSAQEPGASFQIISRDTGFDPLIAHLKEKKVQVQRLQEVTKVASVKVADAAAVKVVKAAKAPEEVAVKVTEAATVKAVKTAKAAKAAKPATLKEQAALIVKNLKKQGAAKPRKVETLTNSINNLFGKHLSKEEIAGLLGELQKQKVIEINDTKITYPQLG